MQEKQVVSKLNEAREAAFRIQNNLRYLSSPPEIEVYQRLVSTYGTERVSASGANAQPVLTSMIRAESEEERLKNEILQKSALLDETTRMISKLPPQANPDYRDILQWYYVEIKTFRQIASIKNMSPRTVQRKNREAIQLLASILK